MDKFLQSIKENLERRKAPSFKEDAWQRMQEKLENPNGNSKRRFGFFWLLPFLFLGLLGSMALNYWFYQNGNEKNKFVENTLTIQTDTIYQTNVIYQTDTIYRDRVIYNNKVTTKRSSALASLFNDFKKLENDFKQSRYASNQFLNFDSQKKNYIAYHLNQTLENQDIRIKDKFTGIDLANARLQNLQLVDLNEFPLKDDLDGLAMDDIPQEKHRELSLQRMIYRMQPKAFFVGANIGKPYPLDRELNNQLYDEEEDFTYGLTFDLAYSEQFRIFGDVSYLYLNYKSRSMGQIFGATTISPPSDNFIFEYVEVQLPILQYSLGLKYLWRPKKQFRPYMAAGISALTILPYELKYEFKDGRGREHYVKNEYEGKEFHANYLFLKTGVEMNIYHNWHWQFDVWYRGKVGQAQKHTFNVMGFKTGIMYQF